MSLKEKLKTLGNTFYNGTEISAQEAAWCRLKLPMTKSSRIVVYINTSPICERARILKPAKSLKKILEEDPTSTDIYSAGDIQRYMQRPHELDDICLAKFVSEYTYVPKVSRTREETDNEDSDVDEIVEPQHSSTSRVKLLPLLNQSGFVKIRRKSKVIRYRKYSIHQDRLNYFRVLVMLYYPWRNEESEVDNANCENIFNANKDVIDNHFRLYNDNKPVDSAQETELENVVAEVENGNNDEPNEENVNNDFNPYTYDENVIQPDIVRDIVGEEVPLDVCKKFPIPKLLTDEQLEILYSTLNEKQHQICIDILNRFKRNDNIPFHYFISGGAGVGKSRLITAIYQSVTNFFRNYGDTELDLPFVLLTAPTGKAAHNIDGITAHQAFSLVVNQSEANCPRLSADISNSLQAKLCKIKLIIIDEISMVSSNMFHNINQRLKQIFNSSLDFANISVLVFGDFNQLSPIGRLIFKPPKLSNTTHEILETLDYNPLWNKFQMIELTEVMRQREDGDFAKALSRYANGMYFKGFIITEMSFKRFLVFHRRFYRSRFSYVYQ